MPTPTKPQPAFNFTSALNSAMVTMLTREIDPPKAPDPASPAAINPAVAHCIQAYTQALAAARGAKKLDCDCRSAAKAAYREALPPLFGRRNIRDFIACVGHAILIDAIDSSDGSKLLYAAQVAFSAHNPRSHRSLQNGAKKRTPDASGSPQNRTQAKSNEQDSDQK